MTKEKRILCFPGGGLHGIFQLKFIEFLQKEYKIEDKLWLLNNVDIFSATSVGALVTIFIIFQYSINDIIDNVDFIAETLFGNTGLLRFFPKDIIALFKNPYDMKKMEKMLVDFLKKSPLNKKIKNKEVILEGITELTKDNFYFYHLNKIYPDKEFYIFGVKSEDNSLIIYNSKFNDNIKNILNSNTKLIDGVISSASAPFYFKSRYLKYSKNFNKVLDGGVGGTNCAPHIGILNKENPSNYRVLVINTGSVSGGSKDQGVGSLTYMLGTLIGASSISHSFLITFVLTKGKIRLIQFPNTDKLNATDSFSVKKYYENKGFLNNEGYMHNILNKNSSVDNIFGVINEDIYKDLDNYNWIKKFFSLD